MRSLYATADTIGTETGGGLVTKNELEALKAVSDEVIVLSRNEIAPPKFHQPESPFLEDYFALEMIKDRHFDLAHFYAGCFSHTIRWLKSQNVKVSYTVAAHDRRVSIEEFHRLGMEYPFHHISDDNLFSIYTEGIRLADLVIAPSTKSAEVLKSDIGCKNVMVVPHGVNLPRRVKPIPERFDVAYVGAIGPDKSLIDLIQAWGLLSYPDSRLILAGSGTETLEPFVRQITDKGNFALLGRVPDVSEVYNACSIAVFPSTTEGFGLGILEAMAHGRPVIASEGAGASEIVKDAGFVVRIRNPQAIADKIHWLKNNRDFAISMGGIGRLIAKKYQWRTIRGKYKRLWMSILR